MQILDLLGMYFDTMVVEDFQISSGHTVWNYDVICFLLIRKVDNFQGKRYQNSSKNQMTAEFYYNFDKNTSGKLQWQIHLMT